MQIYIVCLPHCVTDLCRVANYSIIVRVLNKCKTKRETAYVLHEVSYKSERENELHK